MGEAVTSETEATSVKDFAQPSESVKLVVVKARKLEKQKFGKPDPYVVLTYGTQVEKSKVIKGNLKPEWNLEKVFDVTAKSPKKIISWDELLSSSQMFPSFAKDD